MSEEILTVIISGSLIAIPGILTTILTNKSNRIKTEAKIDNISTDVAELKKTVKEHNNYSTRIVALETEVNFLKKYANIDGGKN